MRWFDRALGAAIRGLTAGGSPLMSAMGRERRARPLLPGERALLSSMLGEALDLDRVRIVRARSLDTWVPGEGHVARTIGDVIYWPTEDLSAPGIDDEDLWRAQPGTLIHEACHAVQFQRGGSVYIGDSVRAQLACILRGRPRTGAYDWRAALDRGVPWARLGAEAQAELIEDAWRYGVQDPRVSAALTEARAGRGWCGSAPVLALTAGG